MKLIGFLAVVRRYWVTFAVVALGVTGLGVGWLVLTPPTYVSTAQLLVSISGSTTAAAYENDQVVAGRVNSYIALLTSDAVSQRVVDRLRLPMGPTQFATKVSATNVPPRTAVIDVAVADESPLRARLLADTVAKEFVSYTNALETPTGQDGQKVHTTVVSPATEPQERRSERIVLGTLAAIVGLLLASAAVWIRSLTDPVVRTARDARSAGVTVLGSVTGAQVISVAELEHYRRLRTRVREMVLPGRGQVVEIVPVDTSVDSAVVAGHLGRSMMLAGGRGVVLDAASARPPYASANDPSDLDGPTHGKDSTAASAMPDAGEDGNPDVVLVGAWWDDTEAVTMSGVTDLVARLREQYQHFLIAAPPDAVSPVASVLTEYASAVLLAVTPGTTKRRDLRRAAENLRASGAQLSGAVLVRKPPDGHDISSCTINREAATTLSIGQ